MAGDRSGIPDRWIYSVQIPATVDAGGADADMIPLRFSGNYRVSSHYHRILKRIDIKYIPIKKAIKEAGL